MNRRELLRSLGALFCPIIGAGPQCELELGGRVMSKFLGIDVIDARTLKMTREFAVLPENEIARRIAFALSPHPR